MTRALVIGNSHVGALKLAWMKAAEKHERHEIDFFALPHANFRRLQFLGSRFGVVCGERQWRLAKKARRMNGVSVVDVADYDRVVLAGFGNHYPLLANLFHQFDIDGLREIGASRRLSRRAFEEICASLALGIIPSNLNAGLAGRPAAVLSRQRIAESYLDDHDSPYDYWRVLGGDFDGVDAAIGVYMDICAGVLADRGITLLRQPPETIEPSGLTAARFTRSSVSWTSDDPHPSTDHSHMNVDYGLHCLTKILEYLDKAESPALAVQP